MSQLLEQLEGFRFANPLWLLLLLTIPFLMWWRGRRDRAAAVGYSSTAILATLGKKSGTKGGLFSSLLLFLGLGLLILAMARPQSGKSLTKITASGVDILLVLDVSRSMLAEDFTINNQRASRVVTVRNVTRDFIKERKNDRMGIVAFAGQPYLVSPLTLDHQWLLDNLNRVEVGLVEHGTAIGSAIASASKRLDDREAKSRIAILLTDGSNNAGSIKPKTAAEAAAALGIKFYTIGAGSRGEVPMPMQTPFGVQYQWMKMEFDEDTLREIADTTGGKYFRATDTKGLKGIYEEIDELEKSEEEVTQYEQYTEFFLWALVPGTLLLLLRYFLKHTTWRRLP